MGRTPTLRLDGREVAFRDGETILDVCRAHGVHVPTLCHLQGLHPPATCRLCLVELAGQPRMAPACATAAAEGMIVTTRSAAIDAHRRATVELLFAGGHHVCAFCPASGGCELQALAQQLGLDGVHRATVGPRPAVDASRPRWLLDPGRCVLCTRCVRACAELEHAGTLGVAGRGARTRIAFDGGVPWGESRTCTDCSRCAAACPTGAILARTEAAQGLRPRAPRVPVPPPAPIPAGARARLATVWLGGCAGCHMALLDLDERLLDLAPHLELAWSPLCDAREFPASVELCLVEGAVTTDEQLALLRRARAASRTLVALGDCAAVGNVPAMRDAAGGAAPLLKRWSGPGHAPALHDPTLPTLLDRVLPLAAAVPVDLSLPGCPPPADLLHRALVDLVAGRQVALAGLARFG